MIESWCCRLGDPSLDSHARFNLSPVPSVEDDQDEERQPIEEDESGEEVDLHHGTMFDRQGTGTTTTVTMFESNDDSHPLDGQGELQTTDTMRREEKSCVALQ